MNPACRDSRDGTIQCPVFSDTQPGQDCPVFSTRKHGTAGKGLSNVPYFQTHSRDRHTCDIFLEPDREIWDFSEGDWGLR